VGEIPLALQSKFLRVLQEKQYERGGGGQNPDGGCADHCGHQRNLKQAVADGAFREDLYYRLKRVSHRGAAAA
jgi:two-component system nitrogen regulation response regulator GlnG